MSNNQQRVDAATTLIDQAKEYLLLERKYLTLDASERLSKILSWLIIVIILFIIGTVAFLLLLLTLIHALAAVIGSDTLAYAIATVLVVALLIIAYARRDAMIRRPIRRAIAEFLRPDSEVDPERAARLAALPDSRNELQLSLRLKEAEMKKNCDKLFETKQPKDPTVGQTVGQYIDHAVTCYNAAAFSFGLFRALKGKKKQGPSHPQQ